MFGNKTLYTTVKCRSMTTKEEFVEKWRNSNWRVRRVFFTLSDGNELVLFVDDFQSYVDKIALLRNGDVVTHVTYKSITEVD